MANTKVTNNLSAHPLGIMMWAVIGAGLLALTLYTLLFGEPTKFATYLLVVSIGIGMLARATELYAEARNHQKFFHHLEKWSWRVWGWSIGGALLGIIAMMFAAQIPTS